MSYDHWKQTEPFNPDTEPLPDDATICADCGGVIPEDDKAYPLGGRRWLCEDCHLLTETVIAGLEREAAWDRERK